MKLLLVDDEPGLRMAIGDYLSRKHEVLEACDGVEAIEIFQKERKHHHPVELIITDLMMPRMNGLDFARKIRKVSQAIPIIVLSAHMTQFDRETYGEFFNHFYEKPTNLRALAKIIGNYEAESA